MTRLMKPSRRTFLAGATALGTAALASPSILRAQGRRGWDRPIIAGLNGREGDPTDISIRRIPEILAEQFDIDIVIEIYPSSQLASDIGQLEGVQNGLFDIASNSTASFAGFTDAFHYMDLPFLYPTWDEALRSVTSDLMMERYAKAEADMPLKMLPIVGGGGYRLLSNRLHQAKTPADMQNVKMRSSFGGAVIDMNTLSSWGAVPTPLPWGESYSGIQQGVIDGMFVQPIWTSIAGFAEILPHGTRVPSNWVGQLQVMNAATWAEMPHDIKDPFMQAAQIAADEGSALDRKVEQQFIDKLGQDGMAIYEPTADEIAEWRAPALATWAESGIDPDLIARING
ncbi:TRAP transporter substrate-binding protein [Microbulbifer sp. S227A]|uniref:TRAP transporter substrate-binding protein n=1 Tax=Microbulbifer sp. S227A TaxID=3415131 RepID=UPI003C7B48A7